MKSFSDGYYTTFITSGPRYVRSFPILVLALVTLVENRIRIATLNSTKAVWSVWSLGTSPVVPTRIYILNRKSTNLLSSHPQSKIHPPEPEKMTAKEDSPAPIRYHSIYMCPLSQRLTHALVAILLVLCLYLQGIPQSTRSIVAFYIISGLIGVCLASVLIDPDTTIRSTRVEGNDADEKGDGDKAGKVVIVSRPLVGYEAWKFQVEATKATDKWFGEVRFEDAYIRL